MTSSSPVSKYQTFGTLLKRHLKNAKMLQTELAAKCKAEGSKIDATILSRMITDTSFANNRKEKTVYGYLHTIFTVLINERVLTSPEQIEELLKVAPLRKTEPGKAIKDELLKHALGTLEKRKELDKPKYYTKQGIELIGRHKDIQAIIKKLGE